jgi:hypothetical protein
MIFVVDCTLAPPGETDATPSTCIPAGSAAGGWQTFAIVSPPGGVELSPPPPPQAGSSTAAAKAASPNGRQRDLGTVLIEAPFSRPGSTPPVVRDRLFGSYGLPMDLLLVNFFKAV